MPSVLQLMPISVGACIWSCDKHRRSTHIATDGNLTSQLQTLHASGGFVSLCVCPLVFQSVGTAWLSVFLTCMQTSLEVCNLLVLCLPGLPDHLSPDTMQQNSLKAGLSVVSADMRALAKHCAQRTSVEVQYLWVLPLPRLATGNTER